MRPLLISAGSDRHARKRNVVRLMHSIGSSNGFTVPGQHHDICESPTDAAHPTAREATCSLGVGFQKQGSTWRVESYADDG